MEELAHRFLVAAHQRRDLGDPFATSAGQHHLAATHLYAIRRAQTGSQGRALLVGERTDKDGRSHTSQDTPFRPTFTEIALGLLAASFGSLVVAYRPVLETLVGIVMLVMGAFLLGLLPRTWSSLLMREARIYLRPSALGGLGAAGPFALGGLFAAGGAACPRPGLAALRPAVLPAGTLRAAALPSWPRSPAISG